MPQCWLNLRYSASTRAEAFTAGAQALGFTVNAGLPVMPPADDDLLITWNRIGQSDAVAQQFKLVIVAENALWGNDFAGHRWLYLARNYHNLSTGFPVGDAQRWDGLSVDLEPFRPKGETVLLPQRGIGPQRTAMPANWAHSAQRRHGGRIRPHPGKYPERFKPLREDLVQADRVVTWGSGAAVLALMWGIRVVSELPGWAAAQDNTVDGRLAMFRRLAWAHATMPEIASGVAIQRLL